MKRIQHRLPSARSENKCCSTSKGTVERCNFRTFPHRRNYADWCEQIIISFWLPEGVHTTRRSVQYFKVVAITNGIRTKFNQFLYCVYRNFFSPHYLWLDVGKTFSSAYRHHLMPDDSRHTKNTKNEKNKNKHLNFFALNRKLMNGDRVNALQFNQT